MPGRKTKEQLNEPQRLDEFMSQAVSDYYASRDPFGRGGDFITAPEICQIFGELIGAWAAHVWMQAGHPKSFNLAELGPGRGTLMEDALRATAKIPGFHTALRLHLVETSPKLRNVQKQKLQKYNPQWHDSVEALPEDAPLILIANEFFDALPIRQFEKKAEGWKERFVYEGKWFYTPADISLPSDAPEDSVFEICPLAVEIADQIGQKIVTCGGAALAIDYGYEGPVFGDTLQAVSAHGYCDPLEKPGEVDLTAHVDFSAIAHAAQSAGCKTYGPVEQGGFLTLLGIFQRAQTLKSPEIDTGVQRLIAPDQMGRLFKVLAFTAPGQPAPEGFAR